MWMEPETANMNETQFSSHAAHEPEQNSLGDSDDSDSDHCMGTRKKQAIENRRQAAFSKSLINENAYKTNRQAEKIDHNKILSVCLL